MPSDLKAGAIPPELGGSGYPSLIDVHAHARDTSDKERYPEPPKSSGKLTRWACMLAWLTSTPMPPLPEMPGRVHIAQDDMPTAAELAARHEADPDGAADRIAARQRAQATRRRNAELRALFLAGPGVHP